MLSEEERRDSVVVVSSDDEKERGGELCLGYTTDLPLRVTSARGGLAYNEACRIDSKIKCRVMRCKSGRDTEFQVYMETTQRHGVFHLGARVRRGLFRKTEFIVSQERPSSVLFSSRACGRVSVDKKRKSFQISSDGVSVGAVEYASDEDPRDFRVVLPSPISGRQVLLENKKPQWSSEIDSYVLNFGGRVSVSSVKNVQLVSRNDPANIVFQTGRRDADEFILDFKYPFSMVQAFGVMLCVFYNDIV
ncbi:MAG: Tub family protein [Amphiamblys sp. WSBS2006]|nr:MAG: Tub family protein [Amphiamblys sp. WSBS2006]